MKQMESPVERIQIETLERAIGNQLSRSGFNQKIIQMAQEENKTPEEILANLKEGGMIDQIMSNLKKNDNSSHRQEKNKLSLLLKLNNGYNFLDYDNSNIIEYQESKKPSYFEIDIQFFGQRFHTKKIPVSSEFVINEVFIMDFNPLDIEMELNYSFLKKISSPLHIVILLNENNTKKLISSKSLEWRWVLCYGSWKIETEFKSPSSLNNVNVGSIEIVLSLLPILDKKLLLPQSNITEKINEERKTEIENTQNFIKFTSFWWENYKSIRPSHANRIIKLFLPTEDRELYAYKPAMSLIEPITVGRALNTPYEAARFVSLIPFERKENPGGEKVEMFHSMHSFLSLKKGDVEDHVVLLCDLLLGFGLDAYIACGICANGPHLWVLTRNKINSNNYKTTFWESLTGQRIDVENPNVFQFYKRIHCVFNHSSFYASMNKDDSVFNTSYEFENDDLWKSIPKDKIANLKKYANVPFLNVIHIDKYKVEGDIERIIKDKVSKFRAGIELKTQWDNKLAHLISPALVNYEMERVSSLTYGNEEFKASVKNYVPEGFTFIAFPFQVSDLDAEKIFGMIMTSDVGKNILNTKGDQVVFAVRCKLYLYPQNIFSLWVIIATKYKVIR